MPHCHQKWDTERAGLDPPCLFHPSWARPDTQRRTHREWLMRKHTDDHSCCGVSGCVPVESMLWWTGSELSGGTGRDFGPPFRSGLAAVPLQMLISSVQTRRNVLHFQGMLIAPFTFPLDQYCSLHSRSFPSWGNLNVISIKSYCPLNILHSFTFFSWSPHEGPKQVL